LEEQIDLGITLSLERISEVTDHFLVVYTDEKEKENSFRIQTKGSKILVLDLMVARPGTYRFGISNHILRSQKGSNSSVSMTILNYNSKEYVKGICSSEDDVWVEVNEVISNNLYGVYIIFEEDPCEFIFWSQGAGVIGIECPDIEAVHFRFYREVLRIESELQSMKTFPSSIDTIYFGNLPIKIGSRILSNGICVLSFKNFTPHNFTTKISFLKKKNIAFRNYHLTIVNQKNGDNQSLSIVINTMESLACIIFVNFFDFEMIAAVEMIVNNKGD